MRVDYALGFVLCGVLIGVPVGMVICDFANAQSPQYREELPSRLETEERLDRELGVKESPAYLYMYRNQSPC